MMRRTMRTGLWTAVCAAALACGAETQPEDDGEVSSNIFGIIKIESVTTNTIIAVPWTWYSAEEPAATHIPSDKLVKTTNLTDGDRLLQYRRDGERGDHYESWILEDGEWTPIPTVTSNAVYQAVSGADGAVSVRGYGLWLVRQHPVYTEGPDKGKPIPFWLHGQSIIRQEVSKAYGGTRTKPTYTMMGNPYCEPVRINDLAFAGDIGRDDRIIVPNGANASKYLEYKSKKGWRWARPTESGDALQNTYDYDVSVPAGTGFWYVRRTAGDLTVTWPMPEDD